MSVELYPYQREAVEVLGRVAENNTLLCLPTGSGKTITAVWWLHEKFLKKGKRVLWWAHRIELVEQALETFRLICPDVNATCWTSNSKDASGQAVLAMIFSSKNLKGEFDCIVIDESHHAAMPSYMDKLKSGDLKYEFLLGLTATPTRLDKKKLPYTNIAYQTTVIDLARKGYLAWPDYLCVRTNQKYRMRMQAGDFSGKSLRKLDNDVRNKMVVDEYMRGGYGTTLVFAVNTHHANQICDRLKDAGVQAEVVWWESSDEHRTMVMEKMRTGDLDVVVNVQLFTEGVDLPGVETIFLARPTASEVLWCQMVGRGTRTNRPCPKCQAKVGKNGCGFKCPACGWAGVDSEASWKERFRVVDFVDDVAKYASLAADWALDHLGAKKEEEEEKEDFGPALVGAMKAIGMRPPGKDEIERILLDVQGVLLYSNKYRKNHKALVTVEQYRSLRKLHVLFPKIVSSPNFTRALTSVYGICCRATEFSLTDWKSIGWALILNYRGIKKTENGGTVYRWIPVKAEDPTQEEIETEIDQAKRDQVRLHTLYRPAAIAEVTKAVEAQIERALPDWIGIIEGAEFRDSVIRVTVNRSFERMSAEVYNFIRETYQEVTDSNIGVEIKTAETKLMALAYVDGSCDYADRIGGWAAVVYYKGSQHEVFSGGAEHTTNNKMELEAVLQVLRVLDLDDDAHAIIRSDSEYVINGSKRWRHGWASSGWKGNVANKAQWQEIHLLLKTMDVRFEHVRAHSGDKWNDYCDSLANKARRSRLLGGSDVKTASGEGGRE